MSCHIHAWPSTGEVISQILTLSSSFESKRSLKCKYRRFKTKTVACKPENCSNYFPIDSGEKNKKSNTKKHLIYTYFLLSSVAMTTKSHRRRQNIKGLKKDYF